MIARVYPMTKLSSSLCIVTFCVCPTKALSTERESTERTTETTGQSDDPNLIDNVVQEPRKVNSTMQEPEGSSSHTRAIITRILIKGTCIKNLLDSCGMYVYLKS